MAGDNKERTEEQWRALIDRLAGGKEPAPSAAEAPAFDDAMARQRVGLVITRAVLGDPLYQLYQLYCGDPFPPPT